MTAQVACARMTDPCLIWADDRVLLDSLRSPQPALSAQLHARVVVSDTVRFDLRPTRSQCRPERGIVFRRLAQPHHISPPFPSCHRIKGNFYSESVSRRNSAKLAIDRRTGKICNLLDALADRDDVILRIGRVFSRQAILHNSRSWAQFLGNPEN